MKQFNKVLLLILMSVTAPKKSMPLKWFSLFDRDNEASIIGLECSVLNAQEVSGSIVTITYNKKTLISITQIPYNATTNVFHTSNAITIQISYQGTETSICCSNDNNRTELHINDNLITEATEITYRDLVPNYLSPL